MVAASINYADVSDVVKDTLGAVIKKIQAGWQSSLPKLDAVGPYQHS